MAQYVLINPVGTRHAGEVLDSVQDGQEVINQLAAFGGVLVPLPNALLQPYIDRCQSLILVGNYDEATAMMQAAYASSTAISGGGTPGSIPIWSGPSTIANSALAQGGGGQVFSSGNFGVAGDPGAGLAIASLTNLGAAATTGTYSQVALTGGSGTGATADVVVTASVVTSITLRNPGQGYVVGDNLACAAIGAAGNVATVASVTNYAGVTGNVYASQRIGAGTNRPIAPLHSTGFGIFEGTSVFARSVSFVSPSAIRAGLVHSSTFVSDALVTSNVAVAAYEAFDFSASTAFQFGYAIETQAVASSSLAGGSTSVRGASFVAQRNAANDLATSATVTGAVANANVASTAGSNQSSNVQGFASLAQNNKSGHTVTTLTGIQVGASAVAGASVTTGYGFYLLSTNTASTWTTLYAMRLAGWSGPTITNRWGVSQEDPLAKSAFYGNLGVGNALDVGAGKVIASLTLTNGGTGYTNNTYSQVALTTVTGTGTGATADIVVAGGIVTTVVLRAPGQGYAVGDTLSCASIGAGSNFLLTVATTASILRSDGTAVAARVGAGTNTPLYTLDAAGGAAVRGTSMSAYLYGGTAYRWNAGLLIDSSADGGTSTATAGAGLYGAVIAYTRASVTGTTSVDSIYAYTAIDGLGTGGSHYGGQFLMVVDNAAITAKSGHNLYGVSGSPQVATAGAGNTWASMRAFLAFPRLLATTAQNASEITAFYAASPSISGAAHVVSNYYALRARAVTPSGGATVTNEWALSLESPTSRSAHYGNFGVGNALDVGAGKIIASFTLTNGGTGYTNGTYSQVALTTVTGSGAGATADIVVAGGIVTIVVLRAPGQGYAVGDTLSCASIGAGAGFLVTVSTTASIVRSDGTVVGTRVGAGTTNPIAGVDSRSAMAVLGTSQFIATNPSFPSSPLNVQAAAYVGTTADPSGRCTPPLGTTIALGYFGNPIFDMSSQTAFCQATGAFFKSSLEIAGNGSSTRVQGVAADARVFGSTISGKTLSIFAFSAQANISADLSNANTFSLITSYTASHSISSTTAQTITAIASFNDTSSFFTGGAHVVTNHYAFRSVAPTLGSATITNRWGISLEDAAANNVFAGRSAMGQAAGTAATAQVDVGASTTAAASLRIRSGTAPTTPNDGDIWFDGTALRIRIAGVTRTVTVT